MRVETTTTVVRNYTHTHTGLWEQILWIVPRLTNTPVGCCVNPPISRPHSLGKTAVVHFLCVSFYIRSQRFFFFCVGIMLLLLLLLLDFFENVVAISPPRMNPFQLTRGLILLFYFCLERKTTSDQRDETTRVASGNERRNLDITYFIPNNTTFTYI